MIKYRIGSVLAQLRMERGLSQEQLSAGIMDKSNLHRIEVGQSAPSKANLEAFFQRLGVDPTNLISIFLSDDMAKYQEDIDALDIHMANQNTGESAQIIARLESDTKFMGNKLNAQHVLAAKVANAINMKASQDVILQLMLDVLSVRRWKFDEDKIETYLLTRMDSRILGMLAMYYFDDGEHERALNIWYKLKQNVEKHCIDNDEKGRRYPKIIYNLTSHLRKLGRHDEVIDLCRAAKDVCLDTDHLKSYLHLCVNEAASLLERGDRVDGESMLRDAYAMCRLLNQSLKWTDKMEKLKDYAAENGIVLE